MKHIFSFSFSSEANDIFTLAFGSLCVPRKQEVSRIAEEAFSRRRNDNPRFKIHLQKRDGEKKTLSLLESEAGSRRVREELTSEGRMKEMRKKIGRRE